MRIIENVTSKLPVHTAQLLLLLSFYWTCSAVNICLQIVPLVLSVLEPGICCRTTYVHKQITTSSRMITKPICLLGFKFDLKTRNYCDH